MTVATSITLLRLLAAMVMLLCLHQDSTISFQIAALVFIGAIASDILDGLVARSYNQVTALGAKLDPLVDKILVYVSLFSLMQLGAVGGAWVFPMFIRDMVVDGLRNKAFSSSTILGANIWGKAKFSFQSVSILCALGYCITGSAMLIDWANFALIAALLVSLPGVLIIARPFFGIAKSSTASEQEPLPKLPLTSRFF
jgi:CDP-diacylglycerol--glycerol-3-phosphate 3-phosphatidyltransferase